MDGGVVDTQPKKDVSAVRLAHCKDCARPLANRYALRCFPCRGQFQRISGMETLHSRFMARVVKGAPGECWTWLGAHAGNGYGHIRANGGQLFQTHRLSYEIHCRKIEPGEVIDHLCRNPGCCNPEHLEAVSMAENTRRGHLFQVIRAKAAQRTHCKRGHPVVPNQHGKTPCDICQRTAADEWRRQNRERVNEMQRQRRGAARDAQGAGA